ncbi:MAG: hypothetical protein IPM92_00565 [Saprospiraceae bacterium]|nr:hypothetical protein [Saprospiraceae bacterium]
MDLVGMGAVGMGAVGMGTVGMGGRNGRGRNGLKPIPIYSFRFIPCFFGVSFSIEHFWRLCY